MKKLVVLFTISMICVGSASAQTIAYDWDGATGVVRWNANVASGNIFTADQAITVTHLGNYPNAGNSTDSPVELYEVDSLVDLGTTAWNQYAHSFTGSLLASVSVGPSPAETEVIIGGGQYVALASPVTLTAGKTYILYEDCHYSRYFSDYLDIATSTVTIGSEITHLDDYFSYDYAGLLATVYIGHTWDPCSPLGGGATWDGGPTMIYDIATVGTVTALDDPMDVWENDPDGTAVRFEVVLSGDPAIGATDTITVDINPDSNGNGVDVTVLPTQLTFTAADWDTPQTVTVKAIDDTVEDDPSNERETDMIGFTVTSAESDPAYDNASLDPIYVTIIDDDIYTVILTLDDPDGLSVSEEGPGLDDYTVVLGCEPASNVTIYPEDTSEPDQVTIVPGTLVFTTGNWDIAQTVTVTAIDDSILEYDPHHTEISHTVQSADTGYHNMTVDNVDVEIAENDCGAWAYLRTDLNYDCFVNLGDLAIAAGDWMDCTLPNIEGLECFNVATGIPPGPPVRVTGKEAYDWDGVTGVVRWNANLSTGNIFTVNEDITVTKLGNYDTGNSTDSPVELYEVTSLVDMGDTAWGQRRHSMTGILLASALVGPGPSVEEIIGAAQYVALASPVALTAGKTYILNEDCFQTRYVTDYLDVTTSGVTIGSEITHVDDYFSYSAAGGLVSAYIYVGHVALPAASVWAGGPTMMYNLASESVTVTLDDPCGLSVSEEGPGPDDYTVVLADEPVGSNVTIHLEDTSEPDQVSIVPVTLVFTTSNWDTAQTVTVTAIDDSESEYDPHYTQISHTVESGDARYNNIFVANVGAAIAENDCGAWGYLAGDFDENCSVGLEDLAIVFGDWLDCTLPNIPGMECFNMDTCAPPGALKAFPSAEGYGSGTIGGRGGQVIRVTNLNNSGPGSFRAACAASGPRTVVFTVGGTIELNGYIDITEPYITIAGQTAPGDGICLKNYGVFITNTHDVIIRYLRIRGGHEEVADDNDTLLIYNCESVVIDHCSVSWGNDETLSAIAGWAPPQISKNITVQWSIISEGLDWYGHSMGSIIGIVDGAATLHHNIYAHNGTRNPRIGSGPGMYMDLDFVNNVLYNWRSVCGYSGVGGNDPCTGEGTMYMNYVGNYARYGPSTSSGYRYYVFGGDTTWCYIYHGDDSNYIYGSASATANNDLAMDGNMQVNPAFTVPAWAEVTTSDALTAYADVISLAGAGDTAHPRGAVDTRIVNDIINGTGSIINSQSEVGGWPTYNGGTPYPDSDQDGMDDDWEVRYGLDPSNPDDHSADRNNDGYTNLEEFLNCMVM